MDENKFAITEDIFIEVSEFRGANRVDIRKWYTTKEGEMARGKNGLNVDVDTWNDIVARFEEIKKFVDEKLGK